MTELEKIQHVKIRKQEGYLSKNSPKSLRQKRSTL